MPEVKSEVHVAFGKRVRALRGERKLSQEKLADKAGIHWSYIGRIERGENNVALTNLLKLAAGLGVDPCDLVHGLKPPRGREPAE